VEKRRGSGAAFYPPDGVIYRLPNNQELSFIEVRIGSAEKKEAGQLQVYEQEEACTVDGSSMGVVEGGMLLEERDC
jgi:hypothetical protein